jgi:hypothetical protein
VGNADSGIAKDCTLSRRAGLPRPAGLRWQAEVAGVAPVSALWGFRNTHKCRDYIESPRHSRIERGRSVPRTPSFLRGRTSVDAWTARASGFDRPRSGEGEVTAASVRKATVRIRHDPAHASRIVLPVVSDP